MNKFKIGDIVTVTNNSYIIPGRKFKVDGYSLNNNSQMRLSYITEERTSFLIYEKNVRYVNNKPNYLVL